MSERIVYFMRGVYACGKSTRAKELAGDTGIVLEVDRYFEVPTEDGIKYLYREKDAPKALKHVYRELKRAMKLRINPIVMDWDCGLCAFDKKVMKRVIQSGYTPKIAEPKSELWNTLRPMIENKEHVDSNEFAEFAQKLFILNQRTHGVSFEKIFKRIMEWQANVTIDDILNYEEQFPTNQKEWEFM